MLDRLRRGAPAPAAAPPDAAAAAFAAGARTQADGYAPTAVEVARDRVILDGRTHARTYYLSALPRHVAPGWFWPVLDLDAQVDVALHIHPIDPAEMARRLDARLADLEAARYAEAQSGRIASAHRTVAMEDILALRDSLARGAERPFTLKCYFQVRAGDAESLEETSRLLEHTVRGAMADLRPALFQQWEGIVATSPAGTDPIGIGQNVDTSTLVTFLPFASSHLGTERGILYGLNLHNNAMVVLDPFAPELANANKVVFATSGAGKSYFCKLEALRCRLLGYDYVVIDPEDEYRRLCASVDGQYVRLVGSAPAGLNPFDLPQGALGEGDDVLAERIRDVRALLTLMICRADQELEPAERGALERAIRLAYERAGITADPATHRRPAPLLRDLFAVLQEGPDPYGFVDRLEPFVRGSVAALFSAPTRHDLTNPFVVFSLRDLDEELHPIAFHLIAGHVWRVTRQHRRPRIFLVDEAWTLVQHQAGGQFLAELARRARKHFLGLTVVSQDVEDFLRSDRGLTVIRNAAVQVLLRQDPSAIDRVAQVYRLSQPEADFLTSAAPGQGLLIALNSRIAFEAVGSAMEHELCTTDPRELAGTPTPEVTP